MWLFRARPIFCLSTFETVPKGVFAALPKAKLVLLPFPILNFANSTRYGLVLSTVYMTCQPSCCGNEILLKCDLAKDATMRSGDSHSTRECHRGVSHSNSRYFASSGRLPHVGSVASGEHRSV
jgi:hypothetical protein